MLQKTGQQALFLLLQMLGIPQHDLIPLVEQGLLPRPAIISPQPASARLGTITTMVWEVAEASTAAAPVGDIAKLFHRGVDALAHLVGDHLRRAQGTETVMAPTPANWATSLEVTRPVLRRFFASDIHPILLDLRQPTLRQKCGTDWLAQGRFYPLSRITGQSQLPLMNEVIALSQFHVSAI